MEKVLLIVNPVSGKKRIVTALPRVMSKLESFGYSVKVMLTTARDDAYNYVKEYGESFDIICCAGGDGTLHEVVKGEVDFDISKKVAYLPCGSVNDFGAMHGIPKNPLRAVNILEKNNHDQFDIGKFQDDIFTYVAAFGTFAAVSYETSQDLKNIFGKGAYTVDILKSLVKLKPTHMILEAEVDGVKRVFEDDYLVGAICNSISVAGIFKLPPDLVDFKDGELEVFLVKYTKDVHMLLDAFIKAKKKDYSSPLIEFFKAKEISIDNPTKAIWALDGEESKEYEHIEVKCLNKRLDLIK